ncbi:MAG TPA: ROK family protein [Candidatus Kapabacteria bacterium]|nr:ROK family protein [Candidatus Kapabacteria bacterium]
MNQLPQTNTTHAIGIDIGGTTIKLAVVNLSNGKILKELSYPTPNVSAKEVAALVARYANVLIHSYTDVTHVGIGVPGSMNADRTVVNYPPNFTKWTSERFSEMVAAELPIVEHVIMDNDAKCAAIAEMQFGSAKNEQFFLLATLGTGVGGAIVSNGEIYRGAFGGAGEFGHVIIDMNGPESLSGIRGVLEAYIGQKYLSDRTLEKLLAGKRQSSLRTFLVSHSLEPKDISDAAIAGDEFAKEVLAESGRYLGIAMASVATLLDIRLFIVTGGVAQAGDLLLEPARIALRENVLAHQRDSVEIRQGKLGTKAGVVGAALLVR